MSEELKPCPFCGAPAEIEHDSDYHEEWFNLGCSRHWGKDVDNNCIAGRMWYTETEVLQADAITIWNTRPDPSSALIEEQAARIASLERERDNLVDEAGDWAGRWGMDTIKLEDELTETKARLSEAVKVIEMFMHSVCHETGFAEAVRHDSGHSYPWPALDQTEAAAKAFIATLGEEK